MARLLGKEHPNTLTSMNNLAQTLYAQGDLAGARKLQEQVLEAMTRLLGKEHPNTLTSMLNLAQMLQAEGDSAGAERHAQPGADAASGRRFCRGRAPPPPGARMSQTRVDAMKAQITDNC